MTLHQLLYFCEVARCSSYRKASEKLFLTQPTLSAAISALEKELGFPLFERTGRRVELTKYGSLYFQEVWPVLVQLQQVTDRVRQMANRSNGTLDLACNPPLFKNFLPRTVRLFLDKPENRDVEVRFHQASSREIVEGIQNGAYDLGFGSWIPKSVNIDFFPVYRQEMVAVVANQHPLAEKNQVTLEELARYPFLAYVSSSGLRRVVDEFWEKAGLEPLVFTEAADEDSIAALAACGFGVGIVAKMGALDFAPVRQLPIQGGAYFRTVFLVSSAQRYLTPAVQQFRLFVEELAMSGGLPAL